MILIMLAALAAQPPVSTDAEMERVLAAVPEAARAKHVVLPDPAAAWIARLPTVAQRHVAMLVLLSYAQPAGKTGSSTAANIAMGLAYVAAEIAQNQDPGRYERDYSIDAPVPMRAPMDSLRGERAARAQRALAWGHRLGLCDAAFVSTLRALPAPVATGEPDLRPVVRDLGMLAYDPGCKTRSKSVSATDAARK